VGEPLAETLVLLFDDPDRSRLLVSASAPLPRLHLTRARPDARRDPAPGGFASLASHHLSGAILAAIEKDPAERVVRLRFAGASGPGKSLVAELLGRASNTILLDAQERVLGVARRMKSEFRRPEPGAALRARRVAAIVSRRARLSAETLASARGAVARRESHPLSDLLLEACPAIGALAAHEIERRTERGEKPFDVLREWLDRVERRAKPSSRARRPRRRDDATVSSTRRRRSNRSTSRARPDTAVSCSRRCLCRGRSGSLRTEFPRFRKRPMRTTAFSRPERRFRARREALAAIAKREARRAGEIASKITRDLAEMEQADRYRILGEALLAGMTRAEKQGDTVRVPDPYDPEQKLSTVPIDPALSLQVNAERYFHRHRKAERGRAGRRDPPHRAGAPRRGPDRRRAASSRRRRSHEDLDGSEAAMRASGIAVGLERRPRRAGRSRIVRATSGRVGAHSRRGVVRTRSPRAPRPARRASASTRAARATRSSWARAGTRTTG
jgi:hypothetical protein